MVTRLTNKGTTHSEPFGNIIIKNMFGHQVDNVQFNNTTPRFSILTDVYKRQTTGCNLGGNSIALGNTSGILSIAAAYVDSETRFDVATNASGYVAITFTGSPLANGSLLIENSTASGTGATATTLSLIHI